MPWVLRVQTHFGLYFRCRHRVHQVIRHCLVNGSNGIGQKDQRDMNTRRGKSGIVLRSGFNHRPGG